MEQTTYRLGCDIGGTFTDFVLVNDKTGQFYTNKCLTTPSDPSDAVERGIRELDEIKPGFMDAVGEVIHGTTLVINAIIERKGAQTGLITTKGFRDVLELGREIRYDAYDIFSEYPEPIVPRPLRMLKVPNISHIDMYCVMICFTIFISILNGATISFPRCNSSTQQR